MADLDCIRDLLPALELPSESPPLPRTKTPRASKPKPVTTSQAKFFSGLVIHRQADPETLERAYMAKHLVQCTLPHKNPGPVPVWSRHNGNLSLSIVPGVDGRSGKSFGYPHGTLPRLLLFWIVREAKVKKSRRLYLGQSLAEFMRDLGLNPDNGSGKRSDARRLRVAMMSLFRATISFDFSSPMRGGGEAFGWSDMQVAPKGMFWWDEASVEQGTLWNSWIELGEDFYNAICDGPVPLHLSALRLLKQSSLALDLYAWSTYRVSYLTKSTFIPWDLLAGQLGCDYTSGKDFQKKASAAFRKVKLVYPELRLDFVLGGRKTKGGIRLHPSRTAVPKLVPASS